MKKVYCNICTNEILEPLWMATKHSDICIHCWIKDIQESTRKTQPTKWSDCFGEKGEKHDD